MDYKRPDILNITDFFLIGFMVIAFFIMLDVIGAAIIYFQQSRHSTSNNLSNKILFAKALGMEKN